MTAATALPPLPPLRFVGRMQVGGDRLLVRQRGPIALPAMPELSWLPPARQKPAQAPDAAAPARSSSKNGESTAGSLVRQRPSIRLAPLPDLVEWRRGPSGDELPRLDLQPSRAEASTVAAVVAAVEVDITSLVRGGDASQADILGRVLKEVASSIPPVVGRETSGRAPKQPVDVLVTFPDGSYNTVLDADRFSVAELGHVVSESALHRRRLDVDEVPAPRSQAISLELSHSDATATGLLFVVESTGRPVAASIHLGRVRRRVVVPDTDGQGRARAQWLATLTVQSSSMGRAEAAAFLSAIKVSLEVDETPPR